MDIAVVAPKSVPPWLKACAAPLRVLWRARRAPRSLVVREIAGLGERRFVAVLQFERQRFLIGGSASSVTLLSHLPEADAGEHPR